MGLQELHLVLLLLLLLVLLEELDVLGTHRHGRTGRRQSGRGDCGLRPRGGTQQPAVHGGSRCAGGRRQFFSFDLFVNARSSRER